MPTYGFLCKCGEEFEVMASIRECPVESVCPQCNHMAKRTYDVAPLISTWEINSDPSVNNPEREAQSFDLMGYTRKVRRQASPILDSLHRRREERAARIKKEGWTYD